MVIRGDRERAGVGGWGARVIWGDQEWAGVGCFGPGEPVSPQVCVSASYPRLAQLNGCRHKHWLSSRLDHRKTCQTGTQEQSPAVIHQEIWLKCPLV